MDIRNIAIIAHVDHGKTTLVDGFLKQSKTFRKNEAYMAQDLIMDSLDQEKERGITILAKNTAITYKNTKINIIDTPGHADFGGEVERTLNMAEAAILVIDAQEGPMPQTRFVLEKAFKLGLKIIVVINKIDKKNADITKTINKTNDLILELAKDDSQLDFPIYYAISRKGKAWDHLPKDKNSTADLSPILDGILKYTPKPEKNNKKPFQLLVSALAYDDFIGKYAIGKITRGTIKTGQEVVLLHGNDIIETSKITKIFQNSGLKKIEVKQAHSGDIVSIAGLEQATIGDTIADQLHPEGLPPIDIEEPTLTISLYANNSPFAGREGKYVTARQLLNRIKKELITNISMRFDISPDGHYILSGRGELHLSVFIETLRREGFELQVGKPQVITKKINGSIVEPIEELTIDVSNEYVNNVISKVSRRKGILNNQTDNSDGTSRLVFEISTRGTLGLRNTLIVSTKGTTIMNSLFLRFDKSNTVIPKLRNGVLIASKNGKAVPYGINNAQQRGTMFIAPQTEVYAGMIVGQNKREADMEVNVTKEKKMTNIRSAKADEAIILTPPTIFTLEQCIDFLEEDELLEVTPKSLRLRKKLLNPVERNRAQSKQQVSA